MGWFWADSIPKVPVAPHPVSSPSATPPPACPMHKADSAVASFPPRADPTTDTPSSCPVKSSSHPLRYPTTPSSPQSSQLHNDHGSSTLSKYNPLNYIPANLTNTRSADSPQTHELPLEREISSIPRGDSEANWEYPSPQQMYNAMLKKGYTETPSEAVESMVAVHNFLNEGAWNEIVRWEKIFAKGLGHGWSMCSKGEEGIQVEEYREQLMKLRREQMGVSEPANEPKGPRLLRFMGRPGEPTPKAKILTSLGYVFPNSFGSEPPFDRHDWYISRTQPNGATKEVRYVIDYYSGGVEPTGEPVFYLDIRPALDTPTAAAERLMRWGGDVWWRASGGSVRDKERRQPPSS